MNPATRRLMRAIVESEAPRFDGSSPGNYRQAPSMKMVFGVWRKVGPLTAAEHAKAGNDHAARHDHHPEKAYEIGHQGNHAVAHRDPKGTQLQSLSDEHFAQAQLHRDLYNKHSEYAANRTGPDQKYPEVPEPPAYAVDRILATSVFAAQGHPHPSRFLTAPGKERAAQRIKSASKKS